MGKRGCVGEFKKEDLSKKEELIWDMWGKRGAACGEKGGVSANSQKKHLIRVYEVCGGHRGDSRHGLQEVRVDNHIVAIQAADPIASTPTYALVPRVRHPTVRRHEDLDGEHAFQCFGSDSKTRVFECFGVTLPPPSPPSPRAFFNVLGIGQRHVFLTTFSEALYCFCHLGTGG